MSAEQTTIYGRYDPRFESVCRLVERNLGEGVDLGVSLFVDIGGRVALDIWGGFTDTAKTSVWGEDTLVNVWATGKTVINLAALMLAEYGELDFDRAVSRYWPEFAQNGKHDVLVRHVLSHTAGVSGWQQPVAIDDLYDWDRAVEMLAEQPPWWDPGTALGYHAVTQGHIVGELVRRITGIPIREFVAEHIAGPLEADFQLGAHEHDWDRIAPVFAAEQFQFDELGEADVARLTWEGPAFEPEFANTAEWRRATIPGAGGHANARSLARILSVITLGGEVRGVQLLSPRTIDRIFETQAAGIDMVMKVPLRFGLGYGLPEPRTVPMLPDGRVCYWGGWGGSIAVMDLDRGMTIAFAMNRMAPDMIGSEACNAYVREIYRCLELPTGVPA